MPSGRDITLCPGHRGTRLHACSLVTIPPGSTTAVSRKQPRREELPEELIPGNTSTPGLVSHPSRDVEKPSGLRRAGLTAPR